MKKELKEEYEPVVYMRKPLSFTLPVTEENVHARKNPFTKAPLKSSTFIKGMLALFTPRSQAPLRRPRGTLSPLQHHDANSAKDADPT